MGSFSATVKRDQSDKSIIYLHISWHKKKKKSVSVRIKKSNKMLIPCILFPSFWKQPHRGKTRKSRDNEKYEKA